jgi:flagellar biosynthesis chaperone FliJ
MLLTKQELLDLKDDVDNAKTAVSELTGQQTALMNQLKTDWGCKTIGEAQNKLAVMEHTIATLEKKIGKGIKELEEKYENNN